MQKIFDEIDEDGSGTIEREEMYNHLKRSKKLTNDQSPELKAKLAAKSKLDQQLWEKIQEDWRTKINGNETDINLEEAKEYIKKYFSEKLDADAATKIID